MIHKEKRGNELYVYWRGKLIYKRWLNKGYGRVFDAFRSFVPSNRDKEQTEPNITDD